MSGGDPMMPRDLDRLLAAADVPAMSAGLIDRIVADAARPDRPVLPAPRPPRARGRAWTRRGVWGGIVAVNLMLATAVAAAFGGGALTFAKIAIVAHHVVEHIRAPFRHAAPRTAPARPTVVHRLAVPASAIRTAPRDAMPMTAPRSFVAMPSAGRPDRQRAPAFPVSAPALRSQAIERPPLHLRSGPYAVRHAEQRRLRHDRSHDGGHGIDGHRDATIRADTPRGSRAEPRAPIVPRTDATADREGLGAGRGSQAEGGRRFDGPRGQGFAATGNATEGRGDDRAGAQAQGPDRTPGWRRRAASNGNGGAPGWRRRAGWNAGGGGDGFRGRGGGGRAGGRMKLFRPGGGGRRPRRF